MLMGKVQWKNKPKKRGKLKKAKYINSYGKIENEKKA